MLETISQLPVVENGSRNSDGDVAQKNVPLPLNPFFWPLLPTNQFFYDVYTRISELDLNEIGLKTQWHVMQPQIKEEEWQGVKRKYWDLARYYCPLARMEVLD